MFVLNVVGLYSGFFCFGVEVSGFFVDSFGYFINIVWKILDLWDVYILFRR